MFESKDQKPLDHLVDHTGQSSQLLEYQDHERQHRCRARLLPWHCRNGRTSLFSYSVSACPNNNQISQQLPLNQWKCIKRTTTITTTRRPSNLMQTTHNCTYFVRCGHFQSCEKDGSHTNWSAIAEKTNATCKLHGSIFYRTWLVAHWSFTLW